MVKKQSLNIKKLVKKYMNEKEAIFTVGFGALGFMAGGIVGGVVGAIVGYALGHGGRS